MRPIARAGPNAALLVSADSIRHAMVDDAENFSICEGSIPLHLENAEMMWGAGVGVYNLFSSDEKQRPLGLSEFFRRKKRTCNQEHFP